PYAFAMCNLDRGLSRNGINHRDSSCTPGNFDKIEALIPRCSSRREMHHQPLDRLAPALAQCDPRLVRHAPAALVAKLAEIVPRMAVAQGRLQLEGRARRTEFHVEREQ